MDHVLNWLWQGCAVALVTRILLRLSDRSRAQARYVICWVAVIAVLLLPVVSSGPPEAFAPQLAVPSAGSAGTVLSIPTAWWTSFTAVAALWALWSSIYLLHLANALLALRRARRGCAPFPSDVESRLRCWNSVSGRGRRTRLVLSPAVQSASVLGGGAPVIAVQPALLERLDTDDVDRVVIHEWAHVQRRDDLVNVPHLAVRVLAGWHPAIWWLERQLRIEREIACDELAVALTGSSKRYAACLTTIARLFPRELQPLGTVGASSSALSTRVVRILSQRHLMSSRWSAVAGSVAVLMIGALSVTLAGHRLVESVAPRSRVDRTLRVTTPAVVSGGPAVLGQMPTSPFESLSAKTRVPKRPRAKSAPRLATRGRAITAEERLPTLTLPLVTSPGQEPVPVARFSPRPDPAPKLASGPALTAPVPAAADLSKPSTLRTGSPWGAVADAGVATARGSQKAGIATASFFTRVGKKVAAAF